MKERNKPISKPFDNQEQDKTGFNKSAYEHDGNIRSADIKNAHASGIGSLERSDENQVGKLSYGKTENDEDVY